MKTVSNALLVLIEIASCLGLNDTDVKNAREYLDHNELGLCFDTVATQMYEYDIEIDTDFYELISQIGKSMTLEKERYSFMQDLIRSEGRIPILVKVELAKIIASFVDKE